MSASEVSAENHGVSVECKSTLMADPGDFLQAHQIEAWLSGVPDGAVVEAVTREVGSQRDPVTATVGLTARWSEVRRG